MTGTCGASKTKRDLCQSCYWIRVFSWSEFSVLWLYWRKQFLTGAEEGGKGEEEGEGGRGRGGGGEGQGQGERGRGKGKGKGEGGRGRGKGKGGRGRRRGKGKGEGGRGKGEGGKGKGEGGRGKGEGGRRKGEGGRGKGGYGTPEPFSRLCPYIHLHSHCNENRWSTHYVIYILSSNSLYVSVLPFGKESIRVERDKKSMPMVVKENDTEINHGVIIVKY